MNIKVRQGDTLWKYSQLFQIPIQLIIDSNPNINPAQLSQGLTVVIPGFTSVDYQIKVGDTLWQIAERRNLSLDALLLLNPGLVSQMLSVGQTIRVPIRVLGWSFLGSALTHMRR